MKDKISYEPKTRRQKSDGLIIAIVIFNALGIGAGLYAMPASIAPGAEARVLGRLLSLIVGIIFVVPGIGLAIPYLLRCSLRLSKLSIALMILVFISAVIGIVNLAFAYLK